MKKIMTFLLLNALSIPAAQAALTWQPAPAGAKPPATGHQGHGGAHGGKPFVLQDAGGAEALLWLPTRVRRPLRVADSSGRVSVGGTGLDNYHLLLARKQIASGEEVALRYIYQHGKPSGVSPSILINANKATLEIVPAPLTREHQRYLSMKPFHFIVRYNGEPLASQPVLLNTSNGSELRAETDEKGVVTFHLPDDFRDVQPGRSSNRAEEFVVAASYVEDGRQYHTTLSAPYYVNPSHWRSTTGGLMAMFAGIVTGLIVLRRGRGNNPAGRA